MQFNNITLDEVIRIYKNSGATKMHVSVLSQLMQNILSDSANLNKLKPEDLYYLIPTYITLKQVQEKNPEFSLNGRTSEFIEEFEQSLADDEGIGMMDTDNDTIFYFDYVYEDYNKVLKLYNQLVIGKFDYMKNKINEMVVNNASKKERVTSVYFKGISGQLPKVNNFELTKLEEYYKGKGFITSVRFERDNSHLKIEFQVE
jgi:hypothetical protein